MRFQVILAATLVAWSVVVVAPAQAGGIEYQGAGAQALGRAGAVVAKSDDPMVLANNPAGLAELRGNQLMFDLNYAFMNACVDPIGYYGWGVYNGGSPIRLPDPSGGEPVMLNLGTVTPETSAYYGGQYDTVCMKQNILPVPQVGFTSRLTERLGVGFGLMFPAATPQGTWGEENGVIRGAAGLRPAATRYMLMSSGTLGVFPTAGLGFRVTDWLRIGASFEWGIVNVDNLSMAAITAGTAPSGDILAHVKATDWFIPAFNASVHLVPFDALDVVAMFRYQDDLVAPGHIDLTTGVFDPRGRPRTKRNVVEAVRQKFPMKFIAAIRYADRLAPRPSGTGQEETKDSNRSEIRDPFLNERWDLELDLEYLKASRHKDLIIDYVEEQAIEFERDNGAISMARFPDALRGGASTDTVIGKHWKDQIAIKLGGSYNILPGVFGVSLGGHYETRGVDPSYMQVDYWPVQRVGLHAGVKVRISGRFDVVASYAHIFQESIVTGAPNHELGTTSYMRYSETGVVDTIDKRAGRGADAPVLEEPKGEPVDGQARLVQNVTKAVAGQTPWIINAGRYRSGLDVVSIGVNAHF